MKKFFDFIITFPIISLLIIGLPVFMINYFAGNPGISGWDANYYFSYAGAVVETGTLNLESSYEKLVENGADPKHFDINKRTAAGKVYNYFPIGHPLLHVPALFLGSIVSPLFEKDPGPFSITGQLFYLLSCILAAAIGLWLIKLQLIKMFDKESAAVSILLLTASSMLGYYWFLLPALSHTSSLFCIGIIIYLFSILSQDVAKKGWYFFLFGLMIGFNTMVRLQDVGYGIFIVILGCIIIRSDLKILDKFSKITLSIIGGFIGFLPQLIHWKWKDGTWIQSQYSDYAFFDWSNPELFKILFSLRHGLFSWHPILLVAFISFVIFFKRQSNSKKQFPLLFGLSFVFFLLCYIGASFSIWWFGDSFGSRPFISVMPLFMIGIAYLWTLMREKPFLKLIFIITSAFFILWNGLLAILFHLGMISRSGDLNISEILNKFLN